ncbi:MAG: tRNA (adenosine(37)-N6)-threonylcarbamoyltransferase complex transferase subunit TsaD [Cyanobacteria bacterium P01_H01_bin.74]
MISQPASKQIETILAIETSCDDTAVAIVKSGRTVLATTILSQADTHARYGGVVPEAAARLHIEQVNGAIETVLTEAGLTLEKIDAFAATLGPGLVGSLLVGANAAKTLSFITNKPFLGVNHLHAHVASNYIQSELEPPFLCLLISGGHTQLIAIRGYQQFDLVGQTRDDAVGEAYDKVARMLSLGYPGGPIIDNLASQGNPKAYRFPQAKLNEPFAFSFSGLKTAVSRTYARARACLPAFENNGLNESDLQNLNANIAASFQYAVVETLFKKTVACAQAMGFSQIALAGGVSANTALRQRFEALGNQPETGYRIYLPKKQFCTDNAAMVGACAYFDPLTADIAYEVFSRAKQ